MILLCLRVEDTAEPEPPTSAVHRCAGCNARIWIAPSGVEYLAQNKGRCEARCFACAPPEIIADLQAQARQGRAPVPTGAVAEIADYIKRSRS